MQFETLTEDNFILYAAKCYDNPNCHNINEFYDDLNKFKYLKKLFYRYRVDGVLKERLITNHIIVLQNVFGVPEISNMLFLKLSEYRKELKPFLVLLNIMPDYININYNKILASDIPMDSFIVEKLRKI
jgi:hypothetical protein